MLEGGYDLTALQHGTEVSLAVLAGIDPAQLGATVAGSEAPSTGSAGAHVGTDVQRYWSAEGLL
jgi:hypothetical protein